MQGKMQNAFKDRHGEGFDEMILSNGEKYS